jgi:acetolactate synthase I/II/III large subunit
MTSAGTIASVDPGPHRAAVIAHWHAVEPGECLVSSGLGFEGFAVPAALAAQAAHPDRRVVCFTGIRGLLLAAPDLATATDLGLPVTIVAFRDEAAGDGSRVDVPGLALALGLGADEARDEAGFVKAFGRAAAVPRPSVIEVRVDASGYLDD